MKKLFLRLVLLTALVGALVILPANMRTSAAGTDCISEYEACLIDCGGTIRCRGACNQQYEWCTIWWPPQP